MFTTGFTKCYKCVNKIIICLWLAIIVSAIGLQLNYNVFVGYFF